MRPITPDEVVDKKATTHRMPQIIEAANELIARHWDGREARFTLVELSDLARRKLKMGGEAFERGELDIEPLFEAAGWTVKFDKPGYNESYAAFFSFTKRKP